MPFDLTTVLWSLLSIFGSLLIINFIIIFHELGHYSAARYFGLISDAVCIGFGRLLYEKKDQRRTKWQLRFWPIGGYVDLSGTNKRKIKQFLGLPYRAKVIIMLGGIIVNALLAVLLLWACNLLGYEYRSTIVGKVYDDGIAMKLGFQPGDRIISVNEYDVVTWKDVAFPMITSKAFDTPLRMSVMRDGKKIQMKATSANSLIIDKDEGILRAYGFSPAVEQWPAIISSVDQNSPAAQAGLQHGDRIMAIDSVPIEYAFELIEYIRQHPNTRANLTIKRDGKIFDRQITFSSHGWLGQRGYLGIRIYETTKDDSLYGYVQYGFLNDLLGAVIETWQYVVIQSATLYLLFIGVLSLDTIGGPIIIISQTYSLFALQNIVMLLHWTAVVNISLAFINLLPIPVFDGGRIVILTIEACKGSRLSFTTQELIDRVTFSLLLGLCVVITYNDLARVIGGIL